jgi:hypothetical protein
MPSSNSNLSIVDGQQAVATAKMLWLWLRPSPLPRIESRRLSWLPHARPWMRHRRVSVPPPSLRRRRRPSPVATQGITIPQDNDDDRSINAGSNPDATLTMYLHVQVANLQNIRLVDTIVLEPSSPDYKRWCNLMLLTLRRYAPDDHVPSNITDLFGYWARLDSIVVTWILCTLPPSLELHEIVWEPMETARQAWLTIEAQFLDNSESRVLQLDARFRTYKQGDLSISDYCRPMKGMANDLHDLGETITDCHLVLNLLQGLNKMFDHMKIFIKRWQPFSSFHTIHNDLELKEIKLDNSGPSGGGCPP